jgi:hypothetical protein
MRRVDDKLVVHIAMRSGSHSLARSVELVDVGCGQRQSVLVRLIGRSDWIQLTRMAFHLDVIAEDISDFMRVGELDHACGTGAIGVPVVYREEACVERITAEQPFVAWVIDGDVRGLGK